MSNIMIGMSKKDRALFAACLYILMDSEARKIGRRRFWMRSHLRRRDMRDRNFTRKMLEDDLKLEIRDQTPFSDYFKVTSGDFERLLAMIGPTIAKKNTNFRSSISPTDQLGLTLRFLASGDSYESLSNTFQISPQSSSRIIPAVCGALKNALHKYLKTPLTNEEWMKIANDFKTKWNFPNCLGATIETFIAVLAPQNSGCQGIHKIALTAIIDADCNFIYADVGFQGKNPNDSVESAFNISNLQGIPPDRALPGRSCLTPFVFVCDDTFPLSRHLMKPYSRPEQECSKIRLFNYHLNKTRSVVQKTFESFLSVYQSLQQPFRLKPERVQLSVATMLCLHNYLRRNNKVNICNFQTMEPVLNSENSAFVEIHTTSPGVLVRDEFTEYFSTSQNPSEVS